VNSKESVEFLKKFNADLFIVVSFGQIMSKAVLSLPKLYCLNIHASLLPAYRGAAPINWAIINGEKNTGISVITLAQTMDAGEILAKAELKIADDDTADIVHDALGKLAAPVLVKTIDKIAVGTAEYTKQDSSEATKAPKLKKSDGFLDFAAPAEQIHNKVRGLWPWPGAAACFVNQKDGRKFPVTIAKTKVACNAGKNDKPGTIDADLNILCGMGILKILELKPHGGKMMDFKSFLNGRGSGLGDYFAPPENKD